MNILIPAEVVARMTDEPRYRRTDPTPEQVEQAQRRWQDSRLLRWRFGSRPARGYCLRWPAMCSTVAVSEMGIVPMCDEPGQPVSESRPCTCHPDDNPPVPCAQKYALSECRAASEPTEAQLEAWQLLADLVAGLEATHWSSWQTTAHFDSALDAARAALAARE